MAHPVAPRNDAQVPRIRQGLTQWQVLVFIALVGLALVMGSGYALRTRQPEENVAEAAREYLKQQDVRPLSSDWVAPEAIERTASLPHPLLQRAAPNFSLPRADGGTLELDERWIHGPVVLVFYYGYYCNHCVAQLFALQADRAKFTAAGAEIIAISPDSPQESAAKFAKYGEFSFPVLADVDNLTAANYGLLLPRAEAQSQRLLHGTFLIDRAGKVRWSHYGPAPFTDNAALLRELAELASERRGPAP